MRQHRRVQELLEQWKQSHCYCPEHYSTTASVTMVILPSRPKMASLSCHL